MKTFKLISLLLFMSIVSGCTLFTDDIPIGLTLSLRIQDASGRDLVKGIEYTDRYENTIFQGLVDNQLYTLRILYDDKLLPMTMDIDLYYTEYLSDDYGHLVFTTVSGSKSNVEITYRLTCPYVFNDNKTHEIVAYCKGKKNYKCYRLTFDGKDIPVEMADGHSDVATGTIVLE